MNSSNRYLKTIPEITTVLLFGIFGYSVISKILDFTTFYGQFASIPIITKLALYYGAYLMVLMEAVLVILLFFKRTRLAGFYLAAGLLLIFTVYIIQKVYLANGSNCGCGGIFEFISLEAHIYMNSVLLLGAVISILLVEKKRSPINT